MSIGKFIFEEPLEAPIDRRRPTLEKVAPRIAKAWGQHCWIENSCRAWDLACYKANGYEASSPITADPVRDLKNFAKLVYEDYDKRHR